MYLAEPVSLTQLYVDNDSTQNKTKGLLNANFQDFMDALSQTGQLELRAGSLKKSISGVFAGAGLAAGSLGGPAGIALGFTIGNTLGKYFGNVLTNRIYGRAIADIADLGHYAKLRHTQLASSIAFQKKIDEAIDNLRQNDNKRKKDAIQEMQV